MAFQESLRDRRPIIDPSSAVEVAADLFAKQGTASELPSERDRNFVISEPSGDKWVLKISQAEEEREVVELQNSVLQHLAASPALPVPDVCKTVAGQSIAEWSDGRRSHLVRMLSYLPGVPLANVRPRSTALLRDVGSKLGQVDAALANFTHTAAHRSLKWDFRNGQVVLKEHLGCIRDRHQRDLISCFQEQLEDHLFGALPELRQSIIQNDANDHNVLVDDSIDHQFVAGLIDFGDMVHSYTVGEIGVAAAYAIFGEPSPLDSIATMVAGYHSVWPLSEAELSVVFHLVCLRLCMSVCISARQQVDEPENAYLSISEQSAWAALKRLIEIPPRLAEAVIRGACGFEPAASHTRVTQWIHDHTGDFHPLVGSAAAPAASAERISDWSDGTYLIHDLSIHGFDAQIPLDEPELYGAIFESERLSEGAVIGIGRYSEPRACYTSEQFQEDASGAQWRTVHIGLDLFESAGTSVHAPLDGVVHSFADNQLPLDYGPTLILKHQPAADVEFFTLYGHLSRDSMLEWQVGRCVAAGEQIGTLGTAKENGNWPPHLHFQLVLDLLGKQGDFPGVAPADQREVWESFCPDPSAFVNTDLQIRFTHHDRAEMLRHRRQRLGKSLSVSYRRPIEMVRGIGPYLFDSMGRRYLDCVNNVAHVGHCHPHVVQAGQRQMTILNTNTRYLNEGILAYADRLARLFPDPLEVVFLVCSGSEANELALRMAMIHTGASDVVALEAGYHGNTSALIDVSSYKCQGPGGAGTPRGVHFAPLPDSYRGPYRGSDSGGRYVADLEQVLLQIPEHRGVAALIAESMPGCGGQIELPANYLKGAYQHVRSRGGLCIADEVQTGFGRVGTHFWAFETQGVLPDIVTMGKPIGNGHPMGALITTREIADSFANGMEYFNTFGGNNVSCAIGMAVLDVIEDEQLQQHALQLGHRWLARLREMQNKHPLIGDVRGRGLFLGVELVGDSRRTPAAQAADYIVNRLRNHRILASTDGPQHNVIKIKPPMTISGDDVEHFCDVLDTVLNDSCL